MRRNGMIGRRRTDHRAPWTNRGGRLVVVALGAIMVLAACTSAGDAEQPVPGGDPATSATSAPADTPAGCANVIDGSIEGDSGTYRISATVLSPDTGWEKYADAWEVRAPDGTVLGTRVLAHPHVDEQPFTRSLGGIEIPESVTTVELAARDLVEGYCGSTFELSVPGR